MVIRKQVALKQIRAHEGEQARVVLQVRASRVAPSLRAAAAAPGGPACRICAARPPAPLPVPQSLRCPPCPLCPPIQAAGQMRADDRRRLVVLAVDAGPLSTQLVKWAIQNALYPTDKVILITSAEASSLLDKAKPAKPASGSPCPPRGAGFLLRRSIGCAPRIGRSESPRRVRRRGRSWTSARSCCTPRRGARPPPRRRCCCSWTPAKARAAAAAAARAGCSVRRPACLVRPPEACDGQQTCGTRSRTL